MNFWTEIRTKILIAMANFLNRDTDQDIDRDDNFFEPRYVTRFKKITYHQSIDFVDRDTDQDIDCDDEFLNRDTDQDIDCDDEFLNKDTDQDIDCEDEFFEQTHRPRY